MTLKPSSRKPSLLPSWLIDHLPQNSSPSIGMYAASRGHLIPVGLADIHIAGAKPRLAAGDGSEQAVVVIA